MGNVDTSQGSSSRELQVYEAPVLRILGDVRQLTLGPSGGGGDSGSAGEQGFDNNSDDNIWRNG